LDIEEGNYAAAMEKLEMVLFLSVSPYETGAAFLRLRLPENHLGFSVRLEQHPANTIEAAYVNLGYSILKTKGITEAVDVIREGLDLFPQSIYLKHCLARLYIHEKKVAQAVPLYQEIAQHGERIRLIEHEYSYLKRRMPKSRQKGS
jgi:tetratricopeptide (TPR) repeat protein